MTYRSDDGYFLITEWYKDDYVMVTHIFSTPIFDISPFITECTYTMNGKLIKYSNSLGDEIDYSKKPVTQTILPKLLRS